MLNVLHIRVRDFVSSTTQESMARIKARARGCETGITVEYLRALYEGYEKRIALFLEIERMLTPPQREHVLHKLQDYIDDIHALAARRAASQ